MHAWSICSKLERMSEREESRPRRHFGTRYNGGVFLCSPPTMCFFCPNPNHSIKLLKNLSIKRNFCEHYYLPNICWHDWKESVRHFTGSSTSSEQKKKRVGLFEKRRTCKYACEKSLFESCIEEGEEPFSFGGEVETKIFHRCLSN